MRPTVPFKNHLFKNLLRTSSIGGILLAGVMAVFVSPPVMAGNGMQPLPVQQVADGVFVHQAVMEEMSAANKGDIGNCGFIVGSAAVAVVDACGNGEIAKRMLASIRQVTRQPVRYLILTHMHPDHVFGMEQILASQGDPPVEVISHASLPDSLTMRGDFYKRRFSAMVSDIPAPNLATGKTPRLISDRLEIDLGDRALELTAWPASHTDNDLTVLDRKTATLWTGDLLFVERAPTLDGSLLGWIATLDRMLALPATRAVPGHGPAATAWPAGGMALKRYLNALAEGVRAVQKRRGTISQAIAEVAGEERNNWHLFEETHARNVTAAFAELEWE